MTGMTGPCDEGEVEEVARALSAARKGRPPVSQSDEVRAAIAVIDAYRADWRNHRDLARATIAALDAYRTAQGYSKVRVAMQEATPFELL